MAHRDRRRNGAGMLVTILVLAGAHPALAVKRHAFATSVTGTGNLGSWPEAKGESGLAAGDAICQTLAGEAGLDNAEGYRAWLSVAATDAYCHVQGRTGKKATNCNGSGAEAGPWFLLTQNGNFTPRLDELTSPGGAIFRGVLQDENQTFLDPPTNSSYWTGTIETGEVSATTCSNWTVASSAVDGTTGIARASAIQWTKANVTACNLQSRLLCLEGGPSEPPAKTAWTPSALAFLTSESGTGNLSTWASAGGESGLEAGDAICRNLAAAAHLPAPDSFVAWLSTVNVDARDRLTLSNVRYRRVDHYQIADNKSDLIDGSNDNSLHVDEWGRYPGSQLVAFTGTSSNGTYSGTSCIGWIAAPPSNVTSGSAVHMRSTVWTAGVGTACLGANRLYCLSNTVTIFWDGFELAHDTSRWSATVP